VLGEPDEDRDGGFTHGGWQAPLLDQESGRVMFEQARSMDALLLGRKTYGIFANYWPRAPEEIPFTSLLNGVPKYVASRTLAGPLGSGARNTAPELPRWAPSSRGLELVSMGL
jgi:dihydrofolate reductase